MFHTLRIRVRSMKTIAALLAGAEVVARSRGAERPAAEHLVMAAFELPDGTASRAFERIGASAQDFSAALVAQEADDLERAGIYVDRDRIGAAAPAATKPDGVHRSEPCAQELFRAAASAELSGGEHR